MKSPLHPRNYYEILEVSESANLEELRSAHRRLAKEYHPDRVPDHLTKLKKEAEERFKEVQQAWEVLSNPWTRKQYDEGSNAIREHQNVSPPLPRMFPEVLDFATLKPGERARGRLTVENAGGPPKKTTFRLSKADGITTFSVPFPFVVDIVVNLKSFDHNTHYTNELVVDCDGVMSKARLTADIQASQTDVTGWQEETDPTTGTPIAVAVLVLLLVAGLMAFKIIFPHFRQASPLSTGVVTACYEAKGWGDYTKKTTFHPGDGVCVYAEFLDVIENGKFDLTFNFDITGPAPNQHWMTGTGEKRSQKVSQIGSSAAYFDVLTLPTGIPLGSYVARVQMRDNLTGQQGYASTTFQVTESPVPPKLGPIWEGRFHVPPSSGWVPFRLEIHQRDANVTGTIKESFFSADIVSDIVGKIDDKTLRFTKKYRETGRSVSYGGELSEDLNWVRGVWNVEGGKGEWQMYVKEKNDYMPEEIKSLLLQRYPGWSPAKSSENDVKTCKQTNASFKHWFVWGDFNGDGNRDYAAEITQTGSTYVLVFLNRGTSFEPMVMETFGKKNGWDILGVTERGKALSDPAKHSTVQLQTDALMGIACQKSAVAYVYSEFGFQRIIVF